MQDLTITVVQTELVWEDAEANREKLGHKLSEITEPTDLIILPEMFSTGFTMNAAALAEKMDGKTISWLSEQAKKKQAVITGSLIIEDAGKYYNRLIWMQPDGKYSCYDKRHLFRMAGETDIYTAGTQKLITELKGWRICPFICYDLRFPVWSRNIQNSYDIILFVANWPAKRNYSWKAMLQVRAIENLAYSVGVNRVGTDGQNIYYSGDSSAFGPAGELLWTQTDTEAIKTLTLNKQALVKYRESFPAHLDADEFQVL